MPRLRPAGVPFWVEDESWDVGRRGLPTTLTDRQREVYEFIRDLIRRRGYGPTVREIATQFDIRSPNGVVCHLKALERKA